MTHSGCDKVVAYSEDDDIHIAWTEYTGGGGLGYDSYYIKFKPSTQIWSYYKEVTDQEWDGGKDPDLTLSPNKVHYTYLAGGYIGKSRDKVKTSDIWESSMQIPFTGSMIQYHKPTVASNNLNVGLRVYYSTYNYSGAFISNSDRPFDQGFWNENVWLRESKPDYKTEVESTPDGKIHFIYFDNDDYKWEHRYDLNQNISGMIAELPYISYPSSNLMANSNDLYLIALGSNVVPSWIKIQRYDAAPLAPQNPQLSANPGNNKVRISWTKNNEADLSFYEVWRKVAELGGVWQNIGTTTNNYFVDNDYLYAPGAGDFTLTYKIRAKDIGNHYSEFSSGVTTRAEFLGKDVSELVTMEYKLFDNYPNPFNPSTKISWQSPVSGHTTLKVYDVLGREVATLINEYKEAGSYDVEFSTGSFGDASNLPSGVYIYKLQAGSFTDVKKMILSK